ncbi:MAG: hypothetical protein JSW50_07925 [Candidatus Latescibacterota bacterium]|nr:MAG: hypothetical protein JSW50_07925 [Candidatus Latescibacterota bacterium]
MPTTAIKHSRYLLPTFAVSCGLIGFEISLMRVLLYASWHHFAFLVISIVLLGFGASGTVLSFCRSWLLRRVDLAFAVLILATAVSMPVSIQLLRHIPAEARFVPALAVEQSLHWLLYWALLFVPFLLGASAIGLALIAAGTRLPTVYAANLTGSALGAVIAPLAMYTVAPAWLGAVMGVVTLCGFFGYANNWRPHRIAVAGITVALMSLWLNADRPQIRVDPFKYQSYVDRVVESDSSVARTALAYGPRAVVAVYEGHVFHELAFLAVGANPPPMLAVLMDGHWAGSVLNVPDEGSAAAVDNTLMAIPYSFVAAEPHVLLLGETGGANIWLAARQRATAIDVVQPCRELDDLLRGAAYENGGRVLDLENVETMVAEPRHYVEHTSASYDLIQLAGLESWAVETGGVTGLRQNNLVTIESLSACMERLTPGGILSVCRVVQTPPRDNVKLLATLVEALDRMGIEDPAQHVVVLRDFLAVCIMVKSTPWASEEIDRIRTVCSNRELTPVYFAGIRDDELNTPDKLPGPPQAPGDWLHHAATMLVSSNPLEAQEFLNKWPFDVRPPTDDRPFFDNFCKLESIGVLKKAFGDLWLTRTELSLVFVLAAMVLITLFGVLFTIVPLLGVRGIRVASGRFAASVYFMCIGLGYLMIEMVMLSRLIHLVGDPVVAGAVTIAGFLLFSGLGSLTAQRLIAVTAGDIRTVRRRRWRTHGKHGLLLALVPLGAVVLWMLEITIVAGGQFALTWRIVLALLLIGPVGFLMGFPMPLGLHSIHQRAPVLVPWAWGINGFASVLAPVLATAVGMLAGFRAAGIIALVFYLAAALLYVYLSNGRTAIGLRRQQ